MDALMIVMRITHIFAGVFWVGSTFMMIRIIEPSVAATGEAGQQFMAHLGTKSRFSPLMAIAGTLSLLSGLVMYYVIFFNNDVAIDSGYGLSLTIGGFFGLVTLILGFVIQFRSIARMKSIRGEIAASGGPPNADQMAEMQLMAGRLSMGTKIATVLMTITLTGMSIAQYA